MAGPRWKSRLLHVAGLLDDPSVREVSITASGLVMASRASGTQTAPPRLSRAEHRSLVGALIEAMRVPFDAEHPEASGRLDGLRVHLLRAPLVEPGPVVRIEKQADLAPSLEELAGREVLTPPMAELLRRGLLRSSILIVGARGTGKSALLGSLAREVADRHRLLLSGVDPARFEAEVADRWFWAKDASLLELAPKLGAALVFAEEPSAKTWLELLAGARPFVATLEAPDMTSALQRLVLRLVMERPAFSSEAAEALLESGLGLLVELGQRAGELSPQVLAFGEPRRTQARLSVRVLARRKPEGGEELALEGSRLVERVGSFGGRVSAPPAPSFVPDETHPERPEHLAMLSLGGLGVVEPAFAVENIPGPDAPVGRVGARELSMLRPEQLVSQSFLVDVSKAPAFTAPASSTRVKTWAETDGGTEEVQPFARSAERAATALSERAPSEVEALPEVAEVSFADSASTLGEDVSDAGDVDPQDDFAGVKTLPPSIPAPPGKTGGLPFPEELLGQRVGKDDGRTLILGGGSATPSATPGDVVDRRALEARPKTGPKVRD